MKKVDENLKNIEKDIEMKLAEKANTAQVMDQMKDLETRISKQLQDRTSHKEMDEALVSYAEITKTTIKQDLGPVALTSLSDTIKIILRHELRHL